MNCTGAQFSRQSKKHVSSFFLQCAIVGILLICACGRKIPTNQDTKYSITRAGASSDLRHSPDRSKGKDLFKTQEELTIKAATSKNTGANQEIGLGKNGGNSNLFSRSFYVE